MVVYNNTGDNVLYDDIERITKEILDNYNDLIKYKINEQEEEYKEAIDNLKRLRQKEKSLYKEVYKKENRAIIFSLVTEKIYDINSDYIELYNDIIPMIYGNKKPYYRIITNLIFKNNMEISREAYKEKKKIKLYGNDPFEYDYRYSRERISNILFELTYLDVMHSFIQYLNIEKQKSINYDIEEELIKAIHYIIFTNPALEDSYINSYLEIDKPYHIGQDVFFELDNIDEENRKVFYKEYFKDIIKENVSSILVLGHEVNSPGIKRFMILHKQLLKAISRVTDGAIKGNILLESKLFEAKKPNIGYKEINEIINNENGNDKILKMSLKKENISN